jgi:hypothetical protein
MGGRRVLERRLDGKRPLGKTRRIWVDNIKMNLPEMRCGGMD